VYLRWIWIQFPWIGLHVAPEVATTLKQIREDEEKHRCVLVLCPYFVLRCVPLLCVEALCCARFVCL
jgi:hypothetical protein